MNRLEIKMKKYTTMVAIIVVFILIDAIPLAFAQESSPQTEPGIIAGSGTISPSGGTTETENGTFSPGGSTTGSGSVSAGNGTIGVGGTTKFLGPSDQKSIDAAKNYIIEKLGEE